MRTGTANLPLHDGKDGSPFPVDKGVYDKSIQILHLAVQKAKIGEYDKYQALKRISNIS